MGKSGWDSLSSRSVSQLLFSVKTLPSKPQSPFSTKGLCVSQSRWDDSCAVQGPWSKCNFAVLQCSYFSQVDWFLHGTVLPVQREEQSEEEVVPLSLSHEGLFHKARQIYPPGSLECKDGTPKGALGWRMGPWPHLSSVSFSSRFAHRRSSAGVLREQRFPWFLMHPCLIWLPQSALTK